MSTDRKIFITQDAEPKTRNLELGGGLESGDGGGYVIGIEELEEQVSAKGGRTHCGRLHKSSKLTVKNCEKVPAVPRHIPCEQI